jgi:hypothetical protein
MCSIVRSAFFSFVTSDVIPNKQSSSVVIHQHDAAAATVIKMSSATQTL